jgi:hypothetical protein
VETTIIEKKRSDLSDVLTQIETLAAGDDFNEGDADILRARASTLKAQIASLTDAMESRASQAQMDDVLARAARTRAATEGVAEAAASGESLGEIFVRSRQFTGYGGIGASSRVSTGVLTRALPMKTTSFMSLVDARTQYRPGAPLRTPLLDLVGGIPTQYGGFKIVSLQVKGTGGAPGPNPVVPTAEGVLKPSVEFEEVPVMVNLETLPVWTQVTRQALEDVPQLRERIDGKLTRLVLQAAEKRVATAITSATLPTAEGGGSLIAGIRNGVAVVQEAGWSPSVVLLSPADWAAMDVELLGKALGSPTVNTAFWDVRPVAVPGMTAGTVIVADLAQAIERYEKGTGVDVYMTDSHADTFTSNVITVLAELRDDSVVVDASAAVSVTAGDASP